MYRICAVIFALTSICFAQKASVAKPESLTDGEKIICLAREAVGLEKQKFESVQYKVKTLILTKTPSGRAIPDFFSEISLVLPAKIQAIHTSGEPFFLYVNQDLER